MLTREVRARIRATETLEELQAQEAYWRARAIRETAQNRPSMAHLAATVRKGYKSEIKRRLKEQEAGAPTP